MTISNWQTKKLGELAEYINGYPFKPTDWVSSGLPIIRIQNLNDENKEYHYFNGNIGEKYRVRKGDILISWSASLGSYIWDRNDAWLNQHIFKVLVNESEIKRNFFYFLSMTILEEMKRKTHGGTMKHITKNLFENIQVQVPPLSIQQQIVERLDAIRKLQELNNKEIEKAEELFESLLSVKFRPNATYRKLNFEDTVILKRGPFGGSLKKEIFVPDGYRVYEQRNAIYDDFANCRYFITEEKYKEMVDFAVKAGDLIISCSGTIGKVALAPDNVSPGIINQALLRITPKRDIVLGTYLKYLIQSKDMQGKMFGNARGSSIKNIVSIKEIRKIAIHLPPIKEQQRIVKELDTIKEAYEGKVSLQDKLSELFESTLNKAMKGELVN